MIFLNTLSNILNKNKINGIQFTAARKVLRLRYVLNWRKCSL